jgi:general stress protein YciG
MAKDPHAAALGKKGGKARMDDLTPEQRKELARKGGKASGKARRAKKKVERT